MPPSGLAGQWHETLPNWAYSDGQKLFVLRLFSYKAYYTVQLLDFIKKVPLIIQVSKGGAL